MGKHTISITNGKGSLHLVDGTYKASALVEGYDASTLSPTEVVIEEGVDTYTFTIKATGKLILHVTDTGERATGTVVEGAKFIRTTETGTTLGIEATTDQDGNATFENIPFSDTGTFTIYYRQTTGDGEHTFDGELKSIVMTEKEKTIEVANPNAPLRNFTLTDASLPNITIPNGQIVLEDS